MSDFYFPPMGEPHGGEVDFPSPPMGEPHGGEVDLENFTSPPWWGGRILEDFGLPPHGAKPGGAFFENTAPPPPHGGEVQALGTPTTK